MMVFLAVIVSFNGLIYRPVEVQAAGSAAIDGLLGAIGGWLLGKGLDWIIDQFDKDKEVMVWNPETNASQSIFDTDIDLSHGIVITPDGQIYLNYSDRNGNGIPDDHDPELESGMNVLAPQGF